MIPQQAGKRAWWTRPFSWEAALYTGIAVAFVGLARSKFWPEESSLRVIVFNSIATLTVMVVGIGALLADWRAGDSRLLKEKPDYTSRLRTLTSNLVASSRDVEAILAEIAKVTDERQAALARLEAKS
ncbi:MAG TPA: hypothetical protein VFQ39_02250 [Longimicrobium sp.]|nr:hypothetical protein [Longimicrobium sp.]